MLTILRSFRAKGIKGEVGNERECPVARYIRWTVGVVAYVWPDMVLLTDDEEKEIETPKEIGESMKRFDSGNYPDLIA